MKQLDKDRPLVEVFWTMIFVLASTAFAWQVYEGQSEDQPKRSFEMDKESSHIIKPAPISS